MHRDDSDSRYYHSTGSRLHISSESDRVVEMADPKPDTKAEATE